MVVLASTRAGGASRARGTTQTLAEAFKSILACRVGIRGVSLTCYGHTLFVRKWRLFHQAKSGVREV